MEHMKIYTFDAPDEVRVDILSALRPKGQDQIYSKFINNANLVEVDNIDDCDLAIYPRRVFGPETLVLDSSVFDAAAKAEKHNKPLILDATSDSDQELNIPEAKILRCGLYKSLKKTFETESPFWSNYRTSSVLNSLEISAKGEKPRVGFCGTTASGGRWATLSKAIVPSPITKWILSKSKLTRKIDVRIIEGISLQLRETALKLLTLDERIDSDFDVTNNRKSYYEKDKANKIALEDLFIENTRKCDYVLCVRGSGNYSGRFYMALNAGKIPVVIDTDLVMPYEEKLNIVKLPITSVEKTGDYILEHFTNTSDREFQEMRMQNRLVYQQYLAPEKFLINFLNDAVHPSLH